VLDPETHQLENGFQLVDFRESISQLVGYRNKHFEVGGFSEQALRSWSVIETSTLPLVEFLSKLFEVGRLSEQALRSW